MSRARLFCHRELGAQRGALIGYAALACVTMMGLFHLVGPRMLSTVEDAGYVVGWFVLVLVLGATVVLAPGAVRHEHEGRDDQFIRRLPGALAPAFAGKLTFLLASALVLGGLGFAVSHLMVWTGELRLENVSLLRELYAAPRHLLTPLLGYAGLAACAVPWVFAVATWLPRGRYSVGVVGVLVIGVAVLANAIRGEDLAMRAYAPLLPWLGWIVPCGVVVAWLSFVRGRRGGGVRRSLLFGTAAMLGALVPPSITLLSAARLYYRPEVAELTTVELRGIEPSGRFALMSGHALGDFRFRPHGVGAQEGPRAMAFRVDLQTGATESLDGVDPVNPGPEGLCQAEWGYYNLTTGERLTRERAAELNSLFEQELDRRPIARVGDTAVYSRRHIEFVDGNGTETFERVVGAYSFQCGDGMKFIGKTGGNVIHLDFATRRPITLPEHCIGFAAVKGIWICSEVRGARLGPWFRFSAVTGKRLSSTMEGYPRPVDFRLGDRILIQKPDRLAIYDPIEDQVTDLLPHGSQHVWNLSQAGRGLSDRFWCGVWGPEGGAPYKLIRIDRTALEVHYIDLGTFYPRCEIPGAWLVGYRDDAAFPEMLNWRTGERRQLFPHQGGAQ